MKQFMIKVVVVTMAAMGVLAYAQSAFTWRWRLCGSDQINDNGLDTAHYIRTYTTGKEVIVCDEIFTGLVAGGQGATEFCVPVQGIDK